MRAQPAAAIDSKARQDFAGRPVPAQEIRCPAALARLESLSQPSPIRTVQAIRCATLSLIFQPQPSRRACRCRRLLGPAGRRQA